MKKSVLKISLGLMLSLTVISCGQKQENVDTDEEYTEEYDETEDEYTKEVLGLAKFSLNINGANYAWEENITADIEESTGFGFSELATDIESSNVYILTLTPMKDDMSYGKSATVTLYSKNDILSGNLENQFTVMHSAKDIEKCLDDPLSCAGIAFISAGDADKENSSYLSESGLLTVDYFKVTHSDDRFISGQMTGKFTFTGTNGLGESNGQVSGSFENALFNMLKY